MIGRGHFMSGKFRVSGCAFSWRAAWIAAALLAAPAQAALVITEVVSSSAAGVNGATGDWFEVTNTGAAVVSLAGYLAGDSGQACAAAPAIGNAVAAIAPGESVIFLSTTTAAVFRAKWGANTDNVRIVANNSAGLGGNDAIRICSDASTQVSSQSWAAHTAGVSREFDSDAASGGATRLSNASPTQGPWTSDSDTGSPGRSNGAVTAPLAPTATAAGGVGSGGFTANWGDLGDETGYIVEICQGAACDFSTLAATQVLAADTASVAVSGLSASTLYRYRVRGVNTGGPGANSNVIDVTTTAAAADTTPDAFSFTDVTGQTRGATVTSNTITVTGIDAATAISISGGDYRIGAGGFTTSAGTVQNNDTVTVRAVASNSANAKVDVVLTIGGVADTFSVTTAASGLVVSEVMSSSAATVTGAAKDWFELSNVSAAAIDLTGLKVGDTGLTCAGALALPDGLTSLAAGESVVIGTDSGFAAAAFASYWSLPASIRVFAMGAGTFGLGSGDSVRICDAGGNSVATSFWTAHTAGTSRNFASDGLSGGSLSVLGSDGARDPDSTGGETAASPGYVSGSMTDVSLVPGAPTVQGESGVGQTGFSANWLVPGSGATPSHYLVETASNAGFTAAVALRAVVAHPATTAAISGLDAGSTYYYRVTAAHGSVLGAASAAEQVDTAPVVGNPPSFASGPAHNTAYTVTLGDSHDVVLGHGLDFVLADVETAAASLALSATSSNPGVLPDANISVAAGAGGARTLSFVPIAAGYANIVLSLVDGDANTVTRSLRLAVSSGATASGATRWLKTRSDWSAAVAVDASYMLVADDESPNLVALFARADSAEPVASYDLTTGNPLGLSAATAETDLEAMTRIGNTLWLTGSHGNNSSGNQRTDRERFFPLTISGSGAGTALTAPSSYYAHLRSDLKTWDAANGHGLGAHYFGLVASAANAGKAPEADTLDGFSIEGLSSSPDDSALWFAFRAPLVAAPGQPAVAAGSASGRSHALIVPVTNPAAIVNGSGGSAGTAVIGAPIRLDLGGRGIRDIKKNASGQYLILAGPPNGATGTAPRDFRLYTWNGNPASAPELRLASFAAFTNPNFSGSPEAIVEVPDPLLDASLIQIISDTGDVVYYGDATVAKDLATAAFKKSRLDSVTLGSPIAIAGVCGTANGATATFIPAANLCAIGAASSVSAGGSSWLWSCAGSNGGANAACTAPYPATGSGGGHSQITDGAGSGWTVAAGLNPDNTPKTAGFIATTGDASGKSPPSLPAGYTFPHGLFDFTLSGGTHGSSATLTITYPSVLPAGTVYWKYGPSPAGYNCSGAACSVPHWYIMPAAQAVIAGNTVVLTIVDGGVGDDDLSANGTIVDQGGPGFPGGAAAIPTLSEWGLILLSGLMAWFGLAATRRRAGIVA